MSIILNIETSSKNCSVCLSLKGKLIDSFDTQDNDFRHSELLTSAIQDILSKNNFNVKDLSAISVGFGPGSFTGIRIGLSVAKGLCYPNKIPLIAISSLKIIANSVKENNKNIISLIKDKGDYYYYSKYDIDLKEIIQPSINYIDSNFLSTIIDDNSKLIVNTEDDLGFLYKLVSNSIEVTKSTISAKHMIELSHKSFDQGKFEDLAYIEPMYVKKPYVS